MVRLKEGYWQELLNATKISIPYGAIKRMVKPHKWPALQTFQFLMVRLKEVCNLHRRKIVQISIPYGAIKSGRMSCLIAHHYAISIPYGAIKSSYRFAKFHNEVEFQFLMVRLKDFLSPVRPIRVLISIPYGAIKSKHQDNRSGMK